ncbi:MAG: tRNA lysidine(34) synthetase TilS, partial [Caryophanon sp.]|nr:tRNA lysidine(34) synthetase TilS [Caryophanon sp.]
MLTNKFLDTLMKEEIIGKEDRILVAFSGGIDSVALLCLLLEVRESFGLRLGAAHLNHGFRENADADEAFCRSFCEEKEVPFFSRKMDVEAYAKAEKVSFEMAGRTLRYAFFEKVMDEQGFSKCATAHHLDDQVETVLLNLVRGTGLKGLTGISPVRGRYIRPLLFYKKSELLGYLEKNQISYRHAHTNDEVEYQRNRIRNAVLPYLEK